jgi:hypothetical protein
MIIAQGKAAEAAALGNTPPAQPSFFFLVWRVRAKPERKKEEIISNPHPGAELRLPRAIIRSSLRDFIFGSLCSNIGERKYGSGTPTISRTRDCNHSVVRLMLTLLTGTVTVASTVWFAFRQNGSRSTSCFNTRRS